MKLINKTIAFTLILLLSPLQSNSFEVAGKTKFTPKEQVLIEGRTFLRRLHERQIQGGNIDKKQALEFASKIEKIATSECGCDDEKSFNKVRSQAYALVAGVYGMLSKESRNIKFGKKSYHSLIKARELDPDNTDAIKGQAVALNMILSKGWIVRSAAAIALGINLRDAQKELIDELRRFSYLVDLQLLADQLEDKL